MSENRDLMVRAQFVKREQRGITEAIATRRINFEAAKPKLDKERSNNASPSFPQRGSTPPKTSNFCGWRRSTSRCLAKDSSIVRTQSFSAHN
jgi:hypothetical protein